MWADSGATILADTIGTVIISVVLRGDTYSYAIEKSTWRIVGLDISGYTTYNATFTYYPDHELPVLHKIALEGEEGLSYGGYEFTNVTINGNGYTPTRNTKRTVRSFNRPESARRILPFPRGTTPERTRAFDISGRYIAPANKAYSQPGSRVLVVPSP